MSKSDAFETALLQLLFNGTAFTGIAQNHATPSDLYMSLHTASPAEGGTLASNEVTTAAYTGYARKQLTRTTGNFTVAGGTVSLAAAQDFPLATGGTGASLTHWAIGNSAGTMLYYGALSSPIPVSTNAQPRINAGTLVTEA